MPEIATLREIKFRVFDKTANKFIYSDEFANFENKLFTLKAFFEFVEDRIVIGEKEISELMQYTGIKDKHGIEIYQDDILKIIKKTDNGETRESIYVVDCILELGWRIIEFNVYPKNIEIIENIHENPHHLCEHEWHDYLLCSLPPKKQCKKCNFFVII